MSSSSGAARRYTRTTTATVVRQSPTRRHESWSGLRPQPSCTASRSSRGLPCRARADPRPLPLAEGERSPNVAAQISASRAMRVSGDDYFGIFLSLDAVDEIERFVAGEEALYVPESVLATIMFTDIVGSTERGQSSATASGEPTRPAQCACPTRARAFPR